MNAFNPHLPEIRYKEHYEDTCVHSSLDLALFGADDFFLEQAVASRIALPMSSGLDMIHFF